jgi:hypothetical protein
MHDTSTKPICTPNTIQVSSRQVVAKSALAIWSTTSLHTEDTVDTDSRCETAMAEQKVSEGLPHTQRANPCCMFNKRDGSKASDED